ncbi:hypothetical protein [Sanguibacter sp. 25GB23B1]|uniref:hypothetical protein n=1 Tax=unclassified Sanguibacter TaxID=2645534 RepID=UPI0032AF7804
MTRRGGRTPALLLASLLGAAALCAVGVSAATGAGTPPGPEALGTPTTEQLDDAVRPWDPADGDVRTWVIGPDAVRQWVVTDDAVGQLEEDGQ